MYFSKVESMNVASILHWKHLKGVFFLFLLLAAINKACAGVGVASINLSANNSITSVYINGASVSLGSNSANWKIADNYGANANLQIVAVRCVCTSTTAGVIGVIQLTDGRRVVTDDLWKVYYNSNGGTPPVDANGRQWYELNYDDSGWPSATIDGVYGIPPWNTGSDDSTNQLDGYMQELGVATIEAGWLTRPVKWSAQWIWTGNANRPVTPVFFRRTLESTTFNAGQPPTSPEQFTVVSTTTSSTTLSWSASFAPAGVAGYRVYWNGLPIATTSATTYQSVAIPFNSYPQNFFYVTAVDSIGNESLPTPFRIVMAPNAQSPSAPTNFHITARAKDGFSMLWDPVPGATRPGVSHYKIKGYKGDVASSLSDTTIELPFSYSKITMTPNTNGDGLYSTTFLTSTKYNFKLFGVDLFRGESPNVATLSSRYTLPNTPTTLASPTGLTVTGSTSTAVSLAWTASATSGVAGYYVYQNGLPVANVSGTNVTVTGLSSSKSYYYQVAAYDTQGNESVNSVLAVAMLGGSAAPSAPQLLEAGRTDTTLTLNWIRPTDLGAVTSYTLKRWTGTSTSGSPTSSFSIADPYLFTASMSGLTSGQDYTFVLVANGLNGLSASSAPLTLKTVSLPTAVGTPLFKFASMQRPDFKLANLSRTVADASAQGCAFMHLTGPFGPQDATTVNNWQSMIPVINSARGNMKVYYTPHMHDNDLGNYKCDVFMQGTGTPVHFAATPYPGVRLISVYDGWASSGYVDNMIPWPTDNDFAMRKRQSLLLKEIQAAEADTSVKWVLVGGVHSDVALGLENLNTCMWKYPILQGYRPVICLSESTNGNPDYQCTWHPGQNYLTTSPQMARANNGAYQIYNVYADRIIVQHRIATTTTNWVNTVYYEISYNRANNQLNPSQVRSTDWWGTINQIGKEIPVNQPNPPWAQNLLLNTTISQPINFQLLGRSAQGNSINYTIVQGPSNGTITGSAPNLTYIPNSGYVGSDLLTYKVNDGQDSNLAWVSFSINDPNAATSVPVLIKAISRKIHKGTAYDLNLPINGKPGIECRSLKGNAIVLDDSDLSGITVTGAWSNSSGVAGYYGIGYLYDSTSGSTGGKSVTYTPTIPTTGNYGVYMRWSASGTRATNVPVDINYDGGSATTTVNQQLNNATWLYLGTYRFVAGSFGNVKIRNDGTNGYTIADAVEFVPDNTLVPDPPQPQIILTFDRPVTTCQAAITEGIGYIDGAVICSGNTVTINLRNIIDTEWITLSLSKLNGITSSAILRMGFLEGDVNGDGTVNVADIVMTNSQSGKPISQSNFQNDIIQDGSININDVIRARINSGHALPQ